MSASDSNISHMAPLATLPDVANHSVGDMVNVKGALYVLTAAPRTNEFQGTAGSTGDGYVGTIVVDGDSRVGSFFDPAAKGEVTWRAANGQTAVRLRILRTAFAADPPRTLSVRIVDQFGSGTKVTLNRDLLYKPDNTDLYAWSITAVDTIDIKSILPLRGVLRL